MAINFLNTVDFNKIESLHIRIENQANDSNAGTSVDGQLYYNTSDAILKVSDGSGGWKEVGGGVESVGISMPSAFSVTNSPVTGSGTLTVTGAGTVSQYIRGDGTLATFPTIPTVPSNIVETVNTTDGTYINLTPNTATDGAVTITADLSATDGTAASGERYLTKTNKWATVASIPGTYTFNVTGDTGTPEAIASGATLDIAGGTNINTVVGATDTVTVNLDNSISLSGTLGVTGATTLGAVGMLGDLNMNSGKITNLANPTAAQGAATKAYVDSLVSGGLTFIDGFNANTGAIDGGGNLTTGASRVAVSVGDYYVVTTAGSFYGSVTLDVGDSVIAKLDAAQGTSDVNDWVIVQGDEGVTTFSNSNGGTYVSYGTTNSGAVGAVNIGDVDLTAVDGTSDTSTRFLSKDNTWDVPSYTTNTDANYALAAEAKSGNDVPLTLTGSSGGSSTTVNLTEGANITLTRNSSGQITIASTDTGALGKKIVLNSSLSYVGKADSGGIRTFAINVANSNVFGSGSTAKNVKCEVIDASTSGATAGQTVYADITRGVNAGGQTYGTASLNIAIVGTPADSAYEVLLTYVG
tara:strand:+ start:2150 stop:3895 length:1746 start_codon:yes stop_codon:yes gene_type:complete